MNLNLNFLNILTGILFYLFMMKKRVFQIVYYILFL